MLKPTIPLTTEQMAFLGELNARTFGLIATEFKDICKRITMNGGMRQIFRKEKGVPTLYLQRHYLYRGPEREAMIHRFFLGDKGSLHDHPAASWGMILHTGYLERLCTHIENGVTMGEYNVDRKPGDWSFRPASVENHDNYEGFHKVKLRSPADAGEIYTLFIMEKRNNYSWGFRSNEGAYIPFDQMNKLEATDKVQSSPDQYGYGWFPTRKA